VAGSFDPETGVGAEWSPTAPERQILFSGGHEYTPTPPGPKYAHGKPWVESLEWPTPSTARGKGQIGRGFSGNQPIDPGQLLGLIQSAGSVTDEGPASGPGWTGTKYGFTIPASKDVPVSVTGTIYIDDTGLVRELTSVGTYTLGVTISEDLTFSDFGTAVQVTVPPASEIWNLGNTYLYTEP
jgi:hypothetical protein